MTAYSSRILYQSLSIKLILTTNYILFRKLDDIPSDQPAGRIELDSTCKKFVAYFVLHIILISNSVIWCKL